MNSSYFLITLGTVVLLLHSGCVCSHSVDKALHRERVEDGAFAGRGGKHILDGQHNTDFDHESILGSSSDAEEFDQLSHEEAKKRLAVLLRKMDTNQDSSIDTKEMHQWILRSFVMLSTEESGDRFDEANEDDDAYVTWDEHMVETYGDLKPQRMDEDTTRMMEEDKDLYHKADKDDNGKLDKQEFLSFSHPEEDESMVPLLVSQALLEKDEDKDGQLSFKEYVNRNEVDKQDEQSLLAEKDQFDQDYDKNMDGYLDRSEIRAWLVPDNAITASTEVQHLFAASDADENGLLSFEEVLQNHELFVGSEVTDYGDHLQNMGRFGDEL